MGLDSRELTPELTRKVVHLIGQVRSVEAVEKLTTQVLGQKVSGSTVWRLLGQVGEELKTSQPPAAPQGEPPELAVVACDGGRIRTRAPGHGRGVHQPQWRETKNASFERMTAAAPSPTDPCPELPSSFCTPDKVASLAQAPPLAVEHPNVKPPADATADAPAERVVYRGPVRLLRTAVSSMACSDDFGVMMQREAQRRRFFEAGRGAFLGDGLAWNWSIWKKHFSGFTPVLDFIHAVQYLFAAAGALETAPADAWARYLALAQQCWQGQVDQVIAALRQALRERGAGEGPTLAEDHPLRPVADAVRYLTNNRSRMDYPAYRRRGLPITSAPMESLIKQINHRVKGTEMFWNQPNGAEAILQIRAAALCEDNRLDDHLRNRPGCPYVRRTNHAIAA